MAKIEEILRKRVECLEELLVCYRVGRRPPENLMGRLDNNKKQLKLLEE